MPSFKQLENNKPNWIANFILESRHKEIKQPITLHWENLNVHSPDTSNRFLINKLFNKNVENNSKHSIKNGINFIFILLFKNFVL